MLWIFRLCTSDRLRQPVSSLGPAEQEGVATVLHNATPERISLILQRQFMHWGHAGPASNPMSRMVACSVAINFISRHYVTGEQIDESVSWTSATSIPWTGNCRKSVEAIRAAVSSGLPHDALETNDALEHALRCELIDIAYSAGINNAETLYEFAFRVSQEGALTEFGD